jgi:hypothetical protein
VSHERLPSTREPAAKEESTLAQAPAPAVSPLELTGVSNASLARLLATRAGQAVLARDEGAAKATASSPGDRLGALTAEADAVGAEFRAWANYAVHDYGEMRAVYQDYVDSYGKAYGQFSKTLDKAQAAAAKEEAMAHIAFEFIVAVGVGLALPAAIEGLGLLGTAAEHAVEAGEDLSIAAHAGEEAAHTGGAAEHAAEAGKHLSTGGHIAQEVAVKTAEIGITLAKDKIAPPASFEVPKEFSADLQAKETWQKLEKVSWLLAQLVRPALNLGDVRVKLHDALAQHGSKPGDDPAFARFVAQAEAANLSKGIANALEGAKITFGVLITDMDTPLAHRSSDDILRELWIRYMASLTDDERNDFMQDEIMDELRRLEIIETRIGDWTGGHLKEGQSTTLPVEEADFESDGGEKPWKEAKDYAYKLDKVGQLAVVVLAEDLARMPLGQEPRAIVRTGGDFIYNDTLRSEPPGEQRSEYFKISLTSGLGFKSGERVMINAVHGDALEVERTKMPSMEIERDDKRMGWIEAGMDADAMERAKNDANKPSGADALDPNATFGPRQPDAISGAGPRPPAPQPDAITGAGVRSPGTTQTPAGAGLGSDRLDPKTIRLLVRDFGLEGTVGLGLLTKEDLTPDLLEELERTYGTDALISLGFVEGPRSTPAENQSSSPAPQGSAPPARDMSVSTDTVLSAVNDIGPEAAVSAGILNRDDLTPDLVEELTKQYGRERLVALGLVGEASPAWP